MVESYEGLEDASWTKEQIATLIEKFPEFAIFVEETEQLSVMKKYM